MAAWPEFPELYIPKGCPDGMVCLTDKDYAVLGAWLAQVVRIHDHLVTTCPLVKWNVSP